MTRKHFIVLLLLVLVIGGVGVYMFKQDLQRWQGPDARLGQKVLPSLQISEVAQIHIRHKKDELNLVNKDGIWGVKELDGFPADPALISELMFKAREWKIVQSQPIAESQRPRVDLAAPDADEGASTLLEFRDQAGKALSTLYLGRKHLGKPPLQVKGFDKGQPDGRYILVGSDPSTLLVISDPLNRVEPKADTWISKEFFRVDRVRTLSVEDSQVTTAYRIERDGERDDWRLAGLPASQRTDQVAAITATNALYQLKFEQVADIKPERLEKATVVRAETFDGLTYTFRVAPMKAEGEQLSFYLHGAVEGEFKRRERVPGKDEKPEDKEKLDKEHAQNMDREQARISREKALAPWVFVVEGKQVIPFLRDRDRFIEQPEKPDTGTPRS